MAKQKESGKEAFANPRNTAAGALKLLDPKLCRARHVRFMAHGSGYAEGVEFHNHMEFLHAIREWGIPTTPNVKLCPNIEAAREYANHLAEEVHAIDFEVDGIVLKVNDFDQRQRMGRTSKAPRWLIAYKWEKYEGTTLVENMDVHVGKTGTLTPVAFFKPVVIAGSTISKASLHNVDEIERLGIQIGDWVVVEKAGKVIPHVVRVELHRRDGTQRPFKFPKRCPECDTPVVRDEDGVYIRCQNPNCPAQLRESLHYFASRGAMDVEGLGIKLIEQLTGTGLVKKLPDVYRLKDRRDELIELERMGEKSVDNLLDRHRGIEIAAVVAADHGAQHPPRRHAKRPGAGRPFRHARRDHGADGRVAGGSRGHRPGDRPFGPRVFPFGGRPQSLVEELREIRPQLRRAEKGAAQGGGGQARGQDDRRDGNADALHARGDQRADPRARRQGGRQRVEKDRFRRRGRKRGQQARKGRETWGDGDYGGRVRENDRGQMTEPRRCPKCGTELPADAAGPVCALPRGARPRHDRLDSPTHRTTDAGAADDQSEAVGRHRSSIAISAITRFSKKSPAAEWGSSTRRGKPTSTAPSRSKRSLRDKLRPNATCERFYTEARAAANLQHPNIVAIHEFGEHEGQLYFTMDYVEGQSLASLVASGPLPVEKAVTYLRAIADAIHYAHQHGILHRDLKPSNILIDRFDQPRVTDFGIAKRIGSQEVVGGDCAPSASSKPGLTTAGEVLGTPSYMSPEQIDADPSELGSPCDVYALGAVLYELLTGRPPFQANTARDTMLKVLQAPPPSIRRLNRRVPRCSS